MNFDTSKSNLYSVFSILYDYSVKNKILDEVAIREIIRRYMLENGLTGLINNVIFKELDGVIYGYYEVNTRIIYFDLNFIINTVYSRHYSDRFYINCINLINQELIIDIFHELNHALRFSLPHSNLDIIDKIGKNVRDLAKNDFDFYKRFHDYFPTEKEANVFGYECCVWLFRYLNEYMPDNYGLNDLYSSFLQMLIDGYDANSFLNNPLKRVVLSSKDSKEEILYIKYIMMKTAIELKNMDLYQRLTFGFPISNDEYRHVNGILDNVSMFQYANYDVKSLILSKK